MGYIIDSIYAKYFDKSHGWKYWRKCRLPSCRREFGTNREWQQFCPGSDHQRRYHKLLRRKHEDVVVELEELKEAIKILREDMIDALETFEKYRSYLFEQFQKGGTPIEHYDMIKEIKRDLKRIKKK